MEEIINIKGMTCLGCEKIITDKLSNIEGILNVEVNLAKSSANLTYDENVLELEDIKEIIRQSGYEVEVQEEKMSLQTKVNIFLLSAILLVVFVIIKNTIGFNFIPQITSNMGYGMLFIVGLLTSLHCVAMCGGINVSQSISYNNKNSSPGKYNNLKPSLLYNIGRVVSYTIIGGIVGTLGGIFNFTGQFKGIVSIFAGVFMLLMGVKLLNLFGFLRRFNIKMPKASPRLVKFFSKGPFFVGMLNGLIPCGPLQSIQLYALGTGSGLNGALSMFFFSLGTFPLMFLVGFASTFMGSKFNKYFTKIGALLVIILGTIMFNRGLLLSGVNINIFQQDNEWQYTSIVNKTDNIQTVDSDILSGKYPDIIVQPDIPVKWNISVKEGDLNGCNNPIVISKYNIEKELTIGENLIEFTPDASSSRISYTCWMGMISGEIIVRNK